MFCHGYNKDAANAIAQVGAGREMAGDHAGFDRSPGLWGLGLLCAALFVLALAARPAQAAPFFVSCGGAAMLGGAQLNCSHLAPAKPPQLCNFSWSLLLPGNVPQVVSGSFLLPSGAGNIVVYQGSGYVASLTAPIVLCQDQH